MDAISAAPFPECPRAAALRHFHRGPGSNAMLRRLVLLLALVVAMAPANPAVAGVFIAGWGSEFSISYSGAFGSSGYLPNLPLEYDDNYTDLVAPIQVDHTEVLWTPEGLGVSRIRGGLSFFIEPLLAGIQVAPGTGVAAYGPSAYSHSNASLSFSSATVNLLTDDTPDVQTRGEVHHRLRGSVAPGGSVAFNQGVSTITLGGATIFSWQGNWGIAKLPTQPTEQFVHDIDEAGSWFLSPPNVSASVEVSSLRYTAALGTDGSTSSISDGILSGVAIEPPDPATARAAISATLLGGPIVDFGAVRTGVGRTLPVLSLENVAGTGTVVKAELPYIVQPPEEIKWEEEEHMFIPGDASGGVLGWIESGQSTVASYTYIPYGRGVHSATVLVPDGGGESELTLIGSAVGPVFQTGLPSQQLLIENQWDSYSIEADLLDFRLSDLTSSHTLSFDITNATTDLDPVPGDSTFTDLTLSEMFLSLYSFDDHMLAPVDFQSSPVLVEGLEPGSVLSRGESLSVNVTLGPFDEPLGPYAYILTVYTDEDGPLGEYMWYRNILLNITAVPEPSSLALLIGLGASLLGCRVRRKRTQPSSYAGGR
jgi:hypothetical protein